MPTMPLSSRFEGRPMDQTSRHKAASFSELYTPKLVTVLR